MIESPKNDETVQDMSPENTDTMPMKNPQVGQPGPHDQGQQHTPHLPAGARVTAGVDTEVGAAAALPAEGDRAARRKWDKAKGMAKKSWSQLTDADFAKAEGSLDKLYDVIHEKVGGAREAIKIRLDKLLV